MARGKHTRAAYNSPRSVFYRSPERFCARFLCTSVRSPDGNSTHDGKPRPPPSLRNRLPVAGTFRRNNVRPIRRRNYAHTRRSDGRVNLGYRPNGRRVRRRLFVRRRRFPAVSNAGAVIRSFRRPVRTENETDGTNVLLSAAVSHGPFQAVIFRRPVRLRSCAERLETIRTTRFFAPIAVTRTRIISPVRVVHAPSPFGVGR